MKGPTGEPGSLSTECFDYEYDDTITQPGITSGLVRLNNRMKVLFQVILN
jgi:hypothetical protein